MPFIKKDNPLKIFNTKAKRLSYIKQRLSPKYAIQSVKELDRLPAGFSLTYVSAGGVILRDYHVTTTDKQTILCVVSTLFGAWNIGGRFYLKIEAKDAYRRLNI